LATLYALVGQPERARDHRLQFQKLSDIDLAATRERIRKEVDSASVREVAVEAHNECARVYWEHGHPAEAEAMWRSAATLDARDVESRTQLARYYEQTGRDRSALAMCEELRDIDPADSDHWLNVGLLKARLYQFDEASVALERAMELSPQSEKYREAHEAIQRAR
jgi:Tfp pilus assembly protein PilF